MLEVQNLIKDYENKPLLKGVSFTVDKGQLVCLLCASGSSKSTVLRIIAGLEEPQSGAVLWQGQNLRDTPTHKRGFGLMFQDYALFPNRTVAANIAFSRPDASHADVEAAARLAGAHDFILRLPEGYATLLGERGFSLSGGQRRPRDRELGAAQPQRTHPRRPGPVHRP